MRIRNTLHRIISLPVLLALSTIMVLYEGYLFWTLGIDPFLYVHAIFSGALLSFVATHAFYAKRRPHAFDSFENVIVNTYKIFQEHFDMKPKTDIAEWLAIRHGEEKVGNESGVDGTTTQE